jgi:hypothetical protein
VYSLSVCAFSFLLLRQNTSVLSVFLIFYMSCSSVLLSFYIFFLFFRSDARPGPSAEPPSMSPPRSSSTRVTTSPPTTGPSVSSCSNSSQVSLSFLFSAPQNLGNRMTFLSCSGGKRWDVRQFLFRQFIWFCSTIQEWVVFGTCFST